MINIIVAEDDLGVRRSLLYMLQNEAEINVSGEAANGLEAVELAKTLLQDLILMDIKLPGINGLEAAKRIKTFAAAREYDTKILILSTFYDDDFVHKSQEYGVDGYLLKGLPPDKLISAIKNTCNGLVTLDKRVYEKQNKCDKQTDLSILTGTERKILKHIVSGKSNAAIATELFLSEGTVRNYVSVMLSKLDCKNSRELAAWGTRAGL